MGCRQESRSKNIKCPIGRLSAGRYCLRSASPMAVSASATLALVDGDGTQDAAAGVSGCETYESE